MKVNVPKIDPEVLRITEEITVKRKKEAKKAARKKWLSENMLGLLGLIVAVLSAISALIVGLLQLRR